MMSEPEAVPSASSWLSWVLAFADSSAPVGSYAHSYGLEGMVHEGHLTGRAELARFLQRDVMESLLRVDLPLLLAAREAAEAGDAAALVTLDEQAWALRPTAKLREAASQVGRQQWRLFRKTWGREAALAEFSFPHHQAPVVAGVMTFLQNVPPAAAARVLGYQTFSALLQASLKLLPVGPQAVQELLHEVLQAWESHCREGAGQLPEEEWGTFNPLWDIAASRHERASARLFLS
ncbi:urease accessory protein UreF [Roseibacillus ishigakijimensis]|uniref:Urease accessory protein UreF n=1 Tax=Roseibacillus ishigakijimensis TaxID=454146 RepID=A0A934RQ75_9BACT|nr:urease accessory UreF family protein [Roseibacillus ishigakijimensis]MBK1833847.1 hypothetical protein [Roseibacillus ishigakijimensis]